MAHSHETSTVRYRFGAHVLDPARRELLRDGVPQPLPARAFECLLCLIEHRDRAVGRDELVRAVFGRRDASDAQLAQIVLRARRAIGDDGHEQRAIRTVPRFGFRWTAEVDVLREAPPAAPAASTQMPTQTPPPQRHAPVYVPALKFSRARFIKPLRLYAALLVLGACGVAWHFATKPDRPPPTWTVETQARNVRAIWHVTLVATDASGQVRRASARHADLDTATHRAAEVLLVDLAHAAHAREVIDPKKEQHL